MIDTDAAIRAILVASSNVTNLVSTRVYEGYIPQGTTADTPVAKPSITYEVDEGSPGDDDTNAGTDVDYAVRCWATTTLGARSLYKVVKDAMVAVQNATHGSVFVYEGREIKPGRNSEDPATGSLYCEAVFRMGFRL